MSPDAFALLLVVGLPALLLALAVAEMKASDDATEPAPLVAAGPGPGAPDYKERSTMLERLTPGSTPEEIEAKRREILAEQPARLQDFIDAHARDVAAYKFSCQRHGDFLQMQFERLTLSHWLMKEHPAVGEIVLKEAVTVNLGAIRTIRLRAGSPPAQDFGLGVYEARTAEGRRLYHYSPAIGHRSVWFERAPNGGDSRRTFASLNPGNRPVFFIEKVARPADDDVIFMGDFGSIQAPAGQGATVEAAILAEVGAYWTAQIKREGV